MAGVGKIILSDLEQKAFREYLLNGGFVMMDDFWSKESIDNVKMEMRRRLSRYRAGGAHH